VQKISSTVSKMHGWQPSILKTNIMSGEAFFFLSKKKAKKNLKNKKKTKWAYFIFRANKSTSKFLS